MRGRVLHFCPFMRYGGTERHLYNLLPGLTREFEVMVCAPEGPMTPAFRERVERIVPYPRSLRVGHCGIRDILQDIKSCIEGFHPDLVHIHSTKEMVLAVRKVVNGMDMPCRIVLTPHTYTGSADFFYTSLFARIADKVIAVSDLERVTLVRFLPSSIRDERVVRIFNGTPLADQGTRGVSSCSHGEQVSRTPPGVPAEGHDSNHLVIGTVGRPSRGKGTVYLLEAFSMLCSEFPGLRLVIVGDSDERPSMESKAIDLGIGDKVTFAGIMHDPSSVMARFDIFVSASLNETLSMSIIEAMALARPVVATRVGGTPQAVVHEETGLLCRPASTKELAECLKALVISPDMRRCMGESGRERAARLFSTRVMIEQTVSLYRDLLEGRS